MVSLRELILVVALVGLAVGGRSYAEFEIRKRHTSGDETAVIGKLSLNIHLPYLTVESAVEGHIGEFIRKQDFEGGHQAILEFVCVDTDLPDLKHKVYMTSVDEITAEPHGQKIAIILGASIDGLAINAINYVQTRQRVGELYAETVSTQATEEETFKYQYASKAAEAENQTFWSKYKWPLIIGGVVVYTMMTSGGGSGPAAAPAASG